MLVENSIHHKYLYEQFYSSEKLANRLIESLNEFNWSGKNVKTLDLCMGEGSLLECVSMKSSSAELYGADIDINNINITKNKKLTNNTNLYHLNTTTRQTLEVFKKEDFDLIVGNPPFKLIEMCSFIKEVCDVANIYKDSRYIEAEVYFLLIGLLLLKKNGYLAYILPDGILTKVSLKPFRKYISSNYTIEKIIESEPRSFSGTEAKTHFIIIKKCKNKTNHINVYSNKLKKIEITNTEFIERGDYSFYKRASPINKITLKDIGAVVLRGRLSKKELEKNGEPNIIHTSSISSEGVELSTDLSASDKVIAQPGDIVIARVGTRCLGKFGVIAQGSYYISDCIIIIRSASHSEQIINTLASPFGQNWIKSVSKGVGARHITITDVYNLPIVN